MGMIMLIEVSMKKISLVFMVCCLLSSGAAAADSLPLATGEWPPYTGAGLDDGGFFTALVMEVVRTMGLEPRVRIGSWGSAEEGVRTGDVWGAFPYAINDEGQKPFWFSEPIMLTRTVFFYDGGRLRDPPQYRLLEDLRAYRIGGVRGYWYESLFARAGLQVIAMESDEENVRALVRGDVDLAAMDLQVGRWLLCRQDSKDMGRISVLDPPLLSGTAHVLISRTYPDAAGLMQRFNAALGEVRRSGRYRKLLKGHGIQTLP